MTDYLELLLEAQEQEEDGWALEWKWANFPELKGTTQVRARLSGKVSAGEGAFDSEAARTQWDKSGSPRQMVWEKQGPAAYVQERGAQEQDPNVTAGEQPRPEAQPLLAEIIRLHRAVRQTNTQISRRTSSTEGAVFGSNGTAWGARITPSKAINYATLVDTAFARDARRYDGPLGLL